MVSRSATLAKENRKQINKISKVKKSAKRKLKNHMGCDGHLLQGWCRIGKEYLKIKYIRNIQG